MVLRKPAGLFALSLGRERFFGNMCLSEYHVLYEKKIPAGFVMGAASRFCRRGFSISRNVNGIKKEICKMMREDNKNSFLSFDIKLFLFKLFTAANLISCLSYIWMSFVSGAENISLLQYLFPFSVKGWFSLFVLSFYILCLIVSFEEYIKKQNYKKGISFSLVPLFINIAFGLIFYFG